MVHPHAHPNSEATRRLGLVLVLTAVYAAAELIGGILSNSLALLADAGHMLGDVLALALALFAARSARRPPDVARTYGYQRAEILAALFNGVGLIVIALLIFSEAWQRFSNPPEIDAMLMGPIAFGGLVVNLIAARILHSHQVGLNMRAAYLHILGDLLGSIGALCAAGLILGFGWTWADPLVSVLIGAIIIYNAVKVVIDAGNVLMEGAPAHLDSGEVREALLQIDGVGDLHDLHLWSLCGGDPLLSAHLVLDHSLAAEPVLRHATRMLRDRFSIDHVTLQVEPPDFNIVHSLSSVGDGSGEL